MSKKCCKRNLKMNGRTTTGSRIIFYREFLEEKVHFLGRRRKLWKTNNFKVFVRHLFKEPRESGGLGEEATI
jgi:hypothetical protein